MQVLLINGSPHPKGSTATALATVAGQLEKAGIAYQTMDVSEHLDLVSQYGIQQAPTLIVRHGDQAEKLVNASVIKKFAAELR